MTDAEELRHAIPELYFEAGLALAAAQRLEYGLALVLLYLSKAGVEDLDAEFLRRVLDGDSKRMAGQLLADLRASVDLAPDAEGIIAAGIRSRNRVVHRFIVENGPRLADATERPKVLPELRLLRADIQRADHLVRSLVSRLGMHVDGVDIDAVMEALAERMRSGGS